MRRHLTMILMSKRPSVLQTVPCIDTVVARGGTD